MKLKNKVFFLACFLVFSVSSHEVFYLEDPENKTYSYYIKPSKEHIRKDCRMLSIIGAGPAGLTAAIAVKNRFPSWEVVVLEKRESFSRNNLLTLDEESIDILSTMGISGDSLAVMQGSLIKNQYICTDGKLGELYHPLCSEQKNHMNYNSSVSISIADFQKILFDEAVKKGVKFIFGVYFSLEDGEKGINIKLLLGENQFHLNPDLMLLASGLKSSLFRDLGFQHEKCSSPLEFEHWHAISAHVSQCPNAIITDIKSNEDTIESLSLGVFYPKRKELVVSLFQKNPELLTEKEAQAIANSLCVKLGIEESHIKWFTELGWRSHYSKSSIFHKKNVLLVGDSAGVGSQVGGNGTGTAFAIKYAINIVKLIKKIEEKNDIYSEYLDEYDKDCSNMVDCWHKSSYETWKKLLTLIKNKFFIDSSNLFFCLNHIFLKKINY